MAWGASSLIVVPLHPYPGVQKPLKAFKIGGFRNDLIFGKKMKIFQMAITPPILMLQRHAAPFWKPLIISFQGIFVELT